MRYIIIGAGAVGGTIGGRLIQGGNEVVLVARGPHLAALQRDGLRLVSPTGVDVLPAHAVDGSDALGELRPDDVLVLTVKSQDTLALVTEWAAVPVAGGGTAGDRLPLVCAQNGVANERTALRFFRLVYGLCVWLPSTHLEPGVVVAHAAPLNGILTVGRYPHGVDPVIEQIAADLSRTAFDAPVVADVMRWKYGKLLNNLVNALQALVSDDASRLWALARAEGEAVLRAAGIPFNTEDERKAVQRDRMQMQPIDGQARVGGSTWQSLARGAGTVEVDYLNGEISLLGRLHDVPTPLNDLLQREVARHAAAHLPPATLTAAHLHDLLRR